MADFSQKGVGDLVKFESRTIDLTPPPRSNRSGLGTFMQVLGALSMPAFAFPGIGTIIGLGGQGLGVAGQQMHVRKNRMETTAGPGGAPVVYPAMHGPAYNQSNSALPAALSSDPALDIISARQASMSEVPGKVGGY